MSKKNIETLRWVGDHLEMIDQRILPEEFTYISYTNASSVAEGIRSMVIRGAPAIGCAAAYGVALEALKLKNLNKKEFIEGLDEGCRVLLESRPTAVNLFWAINRMRNKINESQGSSNQIANILLVEAHEIKREDIDINRAMGSHGAELLNDGARVLTHCNAGALQATELL
jgi:methylthioribose-1-phosphate isomerase